MAEAFSGMGIKPKKNPPSVINLIKRCRAGKPLPFINPLVAIFNCISLKYLLPCGGDDLNVIEGDLRLGIADGTENYVPLGPARRAGAPGSPAKSSIMIWRRKMCSAGHGAGRTATAAN